MANTVQIDLIVKALDEATKTLASVEAKVKRIESAGSDNVKATDKQTTALTTFMARAEKLDKVRNNIEKIRGLWDYVVPAIIGAAGALAEFLRQHDPLVQMQARVEAISKEFKRVAKAAEDAETKSAAFAASAIRAQIAVAKIQGNQALAEQLELQLKIVESARTILAAQQARADVDLLIGQAQRLQTKQANDLADAERGIERERLIQLSRLATGLETELSGHDRIAKWQSIIVNLGDEQVATGDRINELIAARLVIVQSITAFENQQQAETLAFLEQVGKAALGADPDKKKPKPPVPPAPPKDRTPELQRELLLLQETDALERERLRTGLEIGRNLDAVAAKRLRSSEAIALNAIALERLAQAEAAAAAGKKTDLLKALSSAAGVLSDRWQSAAASTDDFAQAVEDVKVKRLHDDIDALTNAISGPLNDAFGQVGPAIAGMTDQFASLAKGQTSLTQAIGAGVGPVLDAIGQETGLWSEFAALRALIEVGLGLATVSVPGKQLEAAGHFAAATVLGVAAETGGGAPSEPSKPNPSAGIQPSANDNGNGNGGSVTNVYNISAGVADWQSVNRGLNQAQRASAGTGWPGRRGF